MQPEVKPAITSHKTAIARIAAKEIALFFASPIAWLFLAAFAAVTLFVFFWGEAFFSRNIADVRPLFEWMPVLLIFLSATLTMRLWSEERRSGTLEYILTRGVPLWQFVVGKFVGCLALLVIALFITLPLPLTVANLGDLDWGPVLGGYLASLLLGAAYLSIGLFVSARSDNQIVSLISATALCGAFYLIGSPAITDLFSGNVADVLRQFGTGSRFDSITRGVIDLRDLYYYLSIILVFLTLNVLVLEKDRWISQRRPAHRRWYAISLLVIANALGANLWLGQISGLRVDATQGSIYSISPATQAYLDQLKEPLLLRGYFSSKTHPLLAPLVPQLKDLLREYEVAGHGKVRVEFVDPQSSPELEEEASKTYGIQPVPFQVADRYQSSIVSSYFNVLVEYGDEDKVLGFQDLIEVQARSESDLDVQLRNPEHDLTRAIKSVMNSWQGGGNLFDTVKGDITFNGYFSSDSELPEALVTLKKDITNELDTMAAEANGRFKVNLVDPAANGGAVAQEIEENYGFRPMATSLLSEDQFYFYMTLSRDDQVIQVPLDDMTAEGFRRNLESGVKRFASGFTKNVALVVPNSGAAQDPYAQMYGPTGPQFNQLQSFLGADLNVVQEDLSDGKVSGDADILMLVAPESMDEKSLFAVDQFLMQGGTVILATSPFSADLTQQGLSLAEKNSGLDDWLKHNGLTISPQLVMDPQNAAFPVPVTRDVGGFQMQDIRMLDYPYFVQVRGQGLNGENLITSELPEATLAWASPIDVSSEQNSQRTITELLRSSNDAWLSESLDVMPKVTDQGLSAFSPEGETGSQLLGVISQGKFDSFFAGKASPLAAAAAAANDKAAEDGAEEDAEVDAPTEEGGLQVNRVIDHSPESARIILFSSNDFLRDQILQLAGSAQRSEYLNTEQMMANAVDWSLEDSGLLSIRSRGHFNRTLVPMERGQQMFWEYLNYGLAIAAIVIIALFERRYRRGKARRYAALLAE